MPWCGSGSVSALELVEYQDTNATAAAAAAAAAHYPLVEYAKNVKCEKSTRLSRSRFSNVADLHKSEEGYRVRGTDSLLPRALEILFFKINWNRSFSRKARTFTAATQEDGLVV